MDIITWLESDEFESIPVNEVGITLAREIMAGEFKTSKTPVQLVSRIQVIMVDAGRCTDKEFVDALRAA